MPSRNSGRKIKLTAEQLEEMIAEATVDAYDDDEQLSGFFTMFEEYLEQNGMFASAIIFISNQSSKPAIFSPQSGQDEFFR